MPRPRNTTEITGPSLFRIIDAEHPTMLLDEGDDILRRKPDLMHVLNTGWNRGKKIPRQVHGETHWFDVFCPKVTPATV